MEAIRRGRAGFMSAALGWIQVPFFAFDVDEFSLGSRTFAAKWRTRNRQQQPQKQILRLRRRMATKNANGTLVGLELVEGFGVGVEEHVGAAFGLGFGYLLVLRHSVQDHA